MRLQALALLRDDGFGRVVHEAPVAQLAFGLPQFRAFFCQLAVETGEFLLDVDQAFQRDQHPELTHQRHGALGAVEIAVNPFK